MSDEVGLTEAISQHWAELGLIAGGVGGALTWAYNFRKKAKADVIAEEQSVLQRELSYQERLESRVKEAEQRAERLLTDNINLRVEAARKGTPPSEVLAQVIASDPGIIWAKRREESPNGEARYVMLKCSFTFGRIFLGGSPDLYTGKTDYDVWPKDVADAFFANDELAFFSQSGQHVEEPVRGSLSGVSGMFIGRKYPVTLQDGHTYLIGTGRWEPDAGQTP